MRNPALKFFIILFILALSFSSFAGSLSDQLVGRWEISKSTNSNFSNQFFTFYNDARFKHSFGYDRKKFPKAGIDTCSGKWWTEGNGTIKAQEDMNGLLIIWDIKLENNIIKATGDTPKKDWSLGPFLFKKSLYPLNQNSGFKDLKLGMTLDDVINRYPDNIVWDYKLVTKKGVIVGLADEKLPYGYLLAFESKKGLQIGTAKLVNISKNKK